MGYGASKLIKPKNSVAKLKRPYLPTLDMAKVISDNTLPENLHMLPDVRNDLPQFCILPTV